jgi:succinate dehydrogenase/fumarate reductase flavoprotein subunit
VTSASDSGGWQKEIDVLVIGSGAAGLTAALVAATEGARTLLCEKTDLIGGTSARSGGTLWIPASDQTNRAGMADTKEVGLRYLRNEIPQPEAAERLAVYIDTGPEAINYLEHKSEVHLYAIPGHPDYRPHPGAATGGRPLGPIPFDGRKLGADFTLLRPPIKEWTIFGGMMVGREDIPHLVGAFKRPESFWYTTKLLVRYAADRLRYNRGTRLVLGNALVGRFFFSLRQAGSEIWTKAEPTELVREGNRVVGAVVSHEGASVRIRVKKGVVLATGGFSHGLEWRRKLMTGGFVGQRSVAFEGNKGNGLDLATKVGAAIDQKHDAPAFLVVLSFMQGAAGRESLWIHSYDRGKPHLIIVNKEGKRFANEATAYHNFVLAMYAANAVPAYLVCDRTQIRKYGCGLIRPGTPFIEKYVRRGYLTRGNTIRELAMASGIEPAGLEQTVGAYNEACTTGVDDPFHKGESRYDKNSGDAANTPNPCMGPLVDPPFYMVKLWPGDIGTSIGLETDENGRAVSSDGTPIEGLYACGNDMSSVMRGHYPGPGVTLGPAVVFAYRAAMQIVHNKWGSRTAAGPAPEPHLALVATRPVN